MVWDIIPILYIFKMTEEIKALSQNSLPELTDQGFGSTIWHDNHWYMVDLHKNLPQRTWTKLNPEKSYQIMNQCVQGNSEVFLNSKEILLYNSPFDQNDFVRLFNTKKRKPANLVWSCDQFEKLWVSPSGQAMDPYRIGYAFLIQTFHQNDVYKYIVVDGKVTEFEFKEPVENFYARIDDDDGCTDPVMLTQNYCILPADGKYFRLQATLKHPLTWETLTDFLIDKIPERMPLNVTQLIKNQ